MFTMAWLKDTAERAIATAAQTIIALLGADGFDLLDVDVYEVMGVSLGALALSVLKSLVASKMHDPNSASLVDLDTPGKHAAPEA